MTAATPTRLKHFLTLAAIFVLAGVLVSETGGRAWLAARPEPQFTPVFDWKGGAGGVDRSGDPAHAYAMGEYKADRGRWVDLAAAEGVSVQVQIMEWDEIEDGPLMAIKGHAPDFCNAANGFVFLGREAPRIWDAGQRVEFDSTAFRSPAGQTVHMFKAAWMAGVGNLPMGAVGKMRFSRLVSSLHKRAGAARVMQVGVFGAGSSDEAWGICEREVLGECVWK